MQTKIAKEKDQRNQNLHFFFKLKALQFKIEKKLASATKNT